MLACSMFYFSLFFPMLDLGALGLRLFFAWFACNQAAMAGSKGEKWSTGNSVVSTNYATSIQTQAVNTATSFANAITGITITSGYPKFTVILRAIQHSDTANNQVAAATQTFVGGAGLPLANPADSSQYVPILQVQVNCTIQPLIIVPFMPNIPGLSKSFNITINTEQQIENIQALCS